MARNLVLASLILTGLAFVAFPLTWPGVARAQAGVLATEELDSGVTLEVRALRRRGPTVQMRIAIVNKSDEDVHPSAYGLAYQWNEVNTTGLDHYDLSLISLVDFDGGKRYKVIRDSKGKCSCSRGLWKQGVVKAGRRKIFFANFSAPPLEVETITIEFEGAPPMDDVPIAQ